MAEVIQLATGKVVDHDVTGDELAYYQGEANTVGGYSIDGVEYPEKVDVPTVEEVESGDVFDPAGYTVEQVREYLDNATPEEQERVLAAEAGGKARVSLIGDPDADPED